MKANGTHTAHSTHEIKSNHHHSMDFLYILTLYILDSTQWWSDDDDDDNGRSCEERIQSLSFSFPRGKGRGGMKKTAINSVFYLLFLFVFYLSVALTPMWTGSDGIDHRPRTGERVKERDEEIERNWSKRTNGRMSRVNDWKVGVRCTACDAQESSTFRNPRSLRCIAQAHRQTRHTDVDIGYMRFVFHFERSIKIMLCDRCVRNSWSHRAARRRKTKDKKTTISLYVPEAEKSKLLQRTARMIQCAIEILILCFRHDFSFFHFRLSHWFNWHIYTQIHVVLPLAAHTHALYTTHNSNVINS